MFARCQVENRGAKLETGAKYERKKAVRQKGVGWNGAKRYENRRIGYEKAQPKWKNRKTLDGKGRKARQTASQGKSGCNVQHTLKERRGRNPYLKTEKSKVEVTLVFLQAGRIRQHPNTYVSISAIRPYAKKEA